MGPPLSPATDVYSLGLVLLESIKQTMEYPGSAVESAVARLHRAPNIPEDLPAEWADLIRSMTAIEPLERPSAADVETALRQALVSPGALPGILAEERTRVLPAPAAGPPLCSAEPAPGDTSPRGPGAGTLTLHPSHAEAVAVPRRESLPVRTAARFRAAAAAPGSCCPSLCWLWSRVVAAVVALATPEPPAVVPYPAVPGDLGKHLKDLQESVEP